MLIDVHPAMEGAPGHDVAESLQANRIDPALLYMTPRQTELWRQVFLRHSPIHANPEFVRIYRESFARMAELAPKRVWLVGLGCGTGLKEQQFCSQLKESEHEVVFSAIDVSRDLVVEAAANLAATGAEPEASLVCDLGHANFVREWLHQTGFDAVRFFTFFGLVPNLAPSAVTRLFHEILLPGDVLLVSVHLAPVCEGVDLEMAMQKVLPQYNNPETMAWLTAALEQWNLDERLSAPVMTIGEIEGIPAFMAHARWKSDDREPMQLFHSLRYTPGHFEELLRSEGFAVERLAMTACREEAIWAVQL